MADKDEKQKVKEREKALDRKYKNYRIPRNGPSPKSSPSKSAESTSVFEVYNSRRSGEKYVEFDEDEKASYAPLTPEKKNTSGGLLSRFMKRLSLDKTKGDLAKGGVNGEEEDVGYIQHWEEEDHGEEEEEEEEDKTAAAAMQEGASTAMGADDLAQTYKGLDFGKDELTKGI